MEYVINSTILVQLRMHYAMIEAGVQFQHTAYFKPFSPTSNGCLNTELFYKTMKVEILFVGSFQIILKELLNNECIFNKTNESNT